MVADGLLSCRAGPLWCECAGSGFMDHRLLLFMVVECFTKIKAESMTGLDNQSGEGQYQMKFQLIIITVFNPYGHPYDHVFSHMMV